MSMTDARVEGTCEPGFEPVRRAFEHNFVEHGERGAALAITVDGNLVVDLWGGDADAKDTPWRRDTIANVYSTTKGMTAICAHMLADRALLDLDAPVTRYWPEFGQAGKQDMPVRYLLTHEAGLPVVDADLPDNAAADWELMCSVLEAQAPIWEPGSAHGYHAVTFGWLVGEVIRRVSGRSVGRFLREEVTGPLGVDFFIGVPESLDPRVATLLRPTPPGGTPPPRTDPQTQRRDQRELPLIARALNLAAPPFAPRNNTREWRAAEIPAANGHTDARALAVMYGALSRGGETGGVRLMSEDAVRRAGAPQVDGPDTVMFSRSVRSLGFMLPSQPKDMRPSHAFGHGGTGGSLGFCDMQSRVGFGYVMNQMWGGGLLAPDPRAQGLVAALYESLGRA